jgi:hypothetical protein
MRAIWFLLLSLLTAIGSAIAVPYLSPSQLLPFIFIPFLFCIFLGLILAAQADALAVSKIWVIPLGLYLSKPSNLLKPVHLGMAQIMLFSAAILVGAILRILFIVYA